MEMLNPLGVPRGEGTEATAWESKTGGKRETVPRPTKSESAL